MYLAIIQYKKQWNDEIKTISKQFNTKEQASDFTWNEMCNSGSKYVTWKSEVCEMG